MSYKRPFLWAVFFCLSIELLSFSSLLAHQEDEVPTKSPLQDGQDDEDQKDEKDHLTPYFFYAIGRSDIIKVRSYIDQGVSINKPFGKRNDTPLIFAIRTLAILISNIKRGAFNDPYTGEFAYKRQVDIIQVILFHENTNMQLENNQGQTAVSLATQEGLKEVLKLLFRKMQLQSLQQQLHIQHSVMMSGGDKNKAELERYKEQLAQLNVSDDIKLKITHAIEKASNMTTEAGKMAEYIKLIFQLPWDKETEDPDNLKQLVQEMDEKQYGMIEAKNKVKEFLAPRILNAGKLIQSKAPILCLVGPPGVGKTSLAKIIAKGLNRAFIRISLGGVHDESSIRGFNKAYVGADPGKIIKELRNKTKNPVILLDEIDKMGLHSANGSPAAALLEVLDPEQNKDFVDHFLDIPFDLSQVLFIATANSVDNIPYALWDRLTIIEIPSYTFQEKLEIGKKFLLPKVVQESGLEDKGLEITEDVIMYIIQHYTYEAGVRNIEKKLRTLCEKVACSYLSTKTIPTITISDLKTYLGAEYSLDIEKVFIKESQIGISNGLGANSVSGSLVIVETTTYPGSGDLKITGQLGEVAQESICVVKSYVKAHAQELGIQEEFLDKHDIHIHSPCGPKEGPSAGIAILSAVVSRLTNRPFNSSYAMTGELSLTGRVLPIGGLREKLSAAKRVGILKVIIPQANVSDLVELQDIIKGMEIIPVSYAHEVLNLVLLPKKGAV